ncbi:MAG: hypothetical protein JXD19_00220 [Deltaproteobacteria bacterium]|nr:hypothetical protein [Deltaproteobacteria bacterium]
MIVRAFFLLNIISLFSPQLAVPFFYNDFSIFQMAGGVSGFCYMSPDGTWGGENLRGTVNVRIVDQELLGISAEVSLEEGYFLYDKWLFDWKETPLTIQMRGAMDRHGLAFEEGEITFADNFRLSGQGSADFEERSIYLKSLKASFADTAHAYREFLEKPLKTLYPVMEKIAIEGKLTVTAQDFSYPEWGGELWASFEGAVSVPGISLDQVSMLVPLCYEGPLRKECFVRIGSLLSDQGRVSNLSFPLTAESGQIHLTKALRIPFAGGSVLLSSLVETTAPFSIAGKLSFENISPRGLPIPAVFASDGASFTLTLEKLSVEGSVVCNVWGGEVLIGGLEINDPVSASPRIKAEIVFKEVDLERLSEYSVFGEVKGAISGYIKDLVIAYGQPEAFELVIETVKDKGKRQSISLTAVNNISILAQGAPIMASWFLPETFPYERIGIKCKLKNDLFYIHGLINDRGLEYLVKRKRFGIDVVNRSPGQPIEFKEMVKRLETISRR